MSPQVWYPIYDIITFTALITNQFATSTFIQILSWPSSWSARSDWLMNKIGDRKMGNCCSHPWVSRGYHVGITIAMGGKIVIIVCLPKIATLGSIVDLTLQKQARILIDYIYRYVSCWLLYMYIYIIMIIWYGDIYINTHIMLTASWFWHQPGVKKWWWTRGPSRWPIYWASIFGGSKSLSSEKLLTMWGPRLIAKLVNITPISLWFMVRK